MFFFFGVILKTHKFQSPESTVRIYFLPGDGLACKVQKTGIRFVTKRLNFFQSHPNNICVSELSISYLCYSDQNQNLATYHHLSSQVSFLYFLALLMIPQRIIYIDEYQLVHQIFIFNCFFFWTPTLYLLPNIINDEELWLGTCGNKDRRREMLPWFW
jgi:hypothetical protein